MIFYSIIQNPLALTKSKGGQDLKLNHEGSGGKQGIDSENELPTWTDCEISDEPDDESETPSPGTIVDFD